MSRVLVPSMSRASRTLSRPPDQEEQDLEELMPLTADNGDEDAEVDENYVLAPRNQSRGTPFGCSLAELAEQQRERRERIGARGTKLALALAAASGGAALAVCAPLLISLSRSHRHHSGGLSLLGASDGDDLPWGEACLEQCDGPGLCPDFCGPGRACCKYYAPGDPPECAGVLDWGSIGHHICVDPVNYAYHVFAHPSKAVEHWSDDCWEPCGNTSGFCQEFCGMGMACCRFEAGNDAPECHGITEWGSKDRHTCVAPVDPVFLVDPEPSGGNVTVDNWGEGCWEPCGNSSGFCQDFCGVGNACCQWGSASQAPECEGITSYGSKDRHTCVKPVLPQFQLTPTAPEGVINYGRRCLNVCGNLGYCQEYCGGGSACCQFQDPNNPIECVGITAWGSKEFPTCVRPTQPHYQTATPANGSTGQPVQHWGRYCWQACGEKSGLCEDFCGAGSACCRFKVPFDAPECKGITNWGSKDRYTCVAPVNSVYHVLAAPPSGEVANWGKECLSSCGGTSGVCPSFCGVGNACCKFGNMSDEPECHGITEYGAKEYHTCVKPVDKAIWTNHLWQDCWQPCDGAGYCEAWCGLGNACCLHGSQQDPAECQGVTFWPRKDVYTCVKSVGNYGIPDHVDKEACRPGEHANSAGDCMEDEEPAFMRFYMYRLMTSKASLLHNSMLANLEGVLWELHKAVVTSCPRARGISRIVRYAVTVKNTDELWEATSNQFAPLQRLQNGTCVAGDSCQEEWDKYGYVVGCETQPTEGQSEPNYTNPVLYSLPGGSGQLQDYGGECAAPDGSATCTWRAAYAGEVLLDELTSVADMATLCRTGQIEYNTTLDKGIGVSFWDFKRNASWNTQRVQYVRDLFKLRYPAYPATLGEPKCSHGT